MTVSAVLIGIFGPVVVFVISRGVPVNAFFAQWALGVILSFYGGPICAWLVESFDPKVRLTSASLGYDLAHATAGGVSPLLATVLADKYGVTSPGLIYPVFAVLSLIGLQLLPCCGSVSYDGANPTSEIEATGAAGVNLAMKNEDGEGVDVPEIT
uniref:Major facilitator superfamily (MFS) profile domain-containing protein n=1 Tax=Odontella aurita TaxID=265563 RepID=A0A7S4K097_9STRA